MAEGSSSARWSATARNHPRSRSPDTTVARQVMRPDLYEEAMQELGYAHGGRDDSPETLFDGKTFDPAKPDEYAASFHVHEMK